MLESKSEQVSTFSPKSLGVQSRSTVNRNVKREDIYSLPLPRRIKDECFVNVTSDRSEKHENLCESHKPCDAGCCSFDASDYRYEIPRCSESSDVDIAHLQKLPGLLTDAEWLDLDSVTDDLAKFPDKNFNRSILASYNTLRFDPSTGLGQVDLWIKRFLRYKNLHSWFHVSLHAGCIKIFLERVKHLPIVILPYGCVYKCNLCSFRKHKRRMILVVRDGAAWSFKCKFQCNKGPSDDRTLKKINNAIELIEAIDYVSRPDSGCVVFNPVIPHALWWMALLVPSCVDLFALERRSPLAHYEKLDISKFLGIANCIVRFDPLNQCIGDPVENLLEHVVHRRPFVFWLQRKVLNVKEMKDVPDDPKQQFVEWSLQRRMNSLLNLNDDSWVSEVKGSIHMHCFLNF